MSIRAVRILTAIYMVAFLIAVTWPGFQLFNHVKPLILGLPFNLFCIALFIIIGMVILFALYRSEQREDKREK